MTLVSVNKALKTRLPLSPSPLCPVLFNRKIQVLHYYQMHKCPLVPSSLIHYCPWRDPAISTPIPGNSFIGSYLHWWMCRPNLCCTLFPMPYPTATLTYTAHTLESGCPPILTIGKLLAVIMQSPSRHSGQSDQLNSCQDRQVYSGVLPEPTRGHRLALPVHAKLAAF